MIAAILLVAGILILTGSVCCQLIQINYVQVKYRIHPGLAIATAFLVFSGIVVLICGFINLIIGLLHAS